MDLDPQKNDPVSISSTLQLACALVLAAYTDCQDSVFGLFIQEPTDPVASVRFVRVNIQPDLAVDTALALLDKHSQSNPDIRSNSTNSLESLLAIGPMGLKQTQQWNSRLQLHAKETCIHDVIADKYRQHPSAPAICARYGSMTYSELDAKSTQLADRLTAFSPEPQQFVGLLFQKSMWTAVSMLGVMKVGNAFVLLDPSLPDQRLKTLCGISHAVMYSRN